MAKKIIVTGQWIEQFDTPRRRNLFRDMIDLADEYEWDLLAGGESWRPTK